MRRPSRYVIVEQSDKSSILVLPSPVPVLVEPRRAALAPCPTVPAVSDIMLPPCDVPPAATVATGADWQQQHPTWLYQGICTGSLADAAGPAAGQPLPVTLEALGEIPLPDGRVVACDPYRCGPDTLPLAERVPPGVHPVATALVEVEADHLRSTALLLVAGSAPIVRWSLALTEPGPQVPAPGDLSSFAVGEFTGYAAAMGSGSLFSPDARLPTGELVDQDIGMFDDPLTEALDACPPLWAAVAAPRPGALPVAACRSGWGDGVYPTWLGHAADGSVVLVMSDFLVLTDPFEGE
jgi:hypothetical protein